MGVRSLLAVCLALTTGTIVGGCKNPEGAPAVAAADSGAQVQKPTVSASSPEVPKAAETPKVAEAPKAAELPPSEAPEAPKAAEGHAEVAPQQPDPSPAAGIQEAGEEEPSALPLMPCEQVLQLGPVGYVDKASNAEDDEPSLRMLLKDMFRRYRSCRQKTVQAQYDALGPTMQDAVQRLRDGLEDLTISVHGLEELRTRGKPTDFLRKRARALMRGEDVAATLVQELAASGASAKELLGKEGFAATHKKAMDFLGRPVDISSGEEEKTGIQYGEGMLRSSGKLERALFQLPASAAQPVLAYIEELVK